MSDVNALVQRECAPCKGGVPPLAGDALHALHAQLDGGWELVGEHHLQKAYKFGDFAGALAFVNRVGDIAEAQNHHPDLYLSWGRVGVNIWTHKLDGLTESDFVFAAKTERAYEDAM